MEQLRVKNIIQISTFSNEELEGRVLNYDLEKVTVLIDDDYLPVLKKIEGGQSIKACVHTHLGRKYMDSTLYEINLENKTVVIENAPAEKVLQKRSDLRIVTDFRIKVIHNKVSSGAKSLNISASGILFCSKSQRYNLLDEITVILPKEVFKEEIKCPAKIVKASNDNYAAKFNITAKFQDKISKIVFEMLEKYM